jgi:hypothetical protein
MAEFTVTLEQLSKIHDISARLSRDPAFLAAVEKAIKEVEPTVSADMGQSSTAAPEVTSADKPNTQRMVSLGLSVPVSDDGRVSVAAIVAHAVGFFSAIGKP